MEKREYVRPSLEVLGQLRDVTGSFLDILQDILGGGRPPGGGSH